LHVQGQGTASTSGASAISLCKLLQDAPVYEGKQVVTVVSVTRYRHRTVITDSTCPGVSIDLLVNYETLRKGSVSRFYKSLRQHYGSGHSLPVTLEGRLKKDDSQRFVANHEYAFELDNVIPKQEPAINPL
jgi:hypothetical protein